MNASKEIKTFCLRDPHIKEEVLRERPERAGRGRGRRRSAAGPGKDP